MPAIARSCVTQTTTALTFLVPYVTNWLLYRERLVTSDRLFAKRLSPAFRASHHLAAQATMCALMSVVRVHKRTCAAYRPALMMPPVVALTAARLAPRLQTRTVPILAYLAVSWTPATNRHCESATVGPTVAEHFASSLSFTSFRQNRSPA